MKAFHPNHQQQATQYHHHHQTQVFRHHQQQINIQIPRRKPRAITTPAKSLTNLYTTVSSTDAISPIFEITSIKNHF